MTKIGSPSSDTPANYCFYVLKFRVREHGMPYALEIDSNDGLKRGMWNLDPQPLKTSYLHYHNVCGHQTLQVANLP